MFDIAGVGERTDAIFDFLVKAFWFTFDRGFAFFDGENIEWFKPCCGVGFVRCGLGQFWSRQIGIGFNFGDCQDVTGDVVGSNCLTVGGDGFLY